ncbi:MAG TPA: hypothetical protein VHU42_05825, partial [Rhodopila sp.]|nr:hypothetical protein [Rhodopila sp.]
MHRRLIVLICATVIAASAVGVGVAHWRQAVARTRDWTGFEVNGLHYAVLLPEHYDRATRYPVVLYLHQLDMGNYPEGLLKQVDGWFNTVAFRTRHPAIVVVPMLDQANDPGGRAINFGGKREGHIGEENTIAALEQVIGRYSTDP